MNFSDIVTCAFDTWTLCSILPPKLALPLVPKPEEGLQKVVHTPDISENVTRVGYFPNQASTIQLQREESQATIKSVKLLGSSLSPKLASQKSCDL